jgi:hypothetical protein
MIDPNPVLVIHLNAGYTAAGRPRQIAMVVNAQGFTLAYSQYHPASNLRDALCPDSHIVSIYAQTSEIRERVAMATASGRMLPACGESEHVRQVFARTLERAEQTSTARLSELEG